MISIDGLYVFAERLSRLNVRRTEADVLEEAARDLELSVKAIVSSLDPGSGLTQHRRTAATSLTVPRRSDEHSVTIGAIGSRMVTREPGSAKRHPNAILSAVARQSGPAIAERIGQIFAELLSGMRYD